MRAKREQRSILSDLRRAESMEIPVARAPRLATARALNLALLCLLLAGLGCSDKTIYGLKLGMPRGDLQSALKVAPQEGGAAQAWVREGEVDGFEFAGGLPTKLRTRSLEGKVVSIWCRADREGQVAAGENPVLFPQGFREMQLDREGWLGPFEHLGTMFKMSPEGELRSYASDTQGFSLGQYAIHAFGMNEVNCAAAEALLPDFLKELGQKFGPLRDRGEASRVVALEGLLPKAAAIELSCPEGAGGLTAVANFFALSGDPAAAKVRFLKALKAGKNWGSLQRADAQAGLGSLALRFGDTAAAQERFSQAQASASTARDRGRIAKQYADALHDRELYGPAAAQYRIYLQNTDTKDPDELSFARSRLVRASLEESGGCAKARPAAEAALALEGAGPRARASVLASEAFRVIACEPKKKRVGYARLKEAVALDPLMAAEWSRLTAYYDREAQDATVLQIMLDQGWLDKKGIDAAKAFQEAERESIR